ncbi:MAG: hypothetical protein K8T25_22450 [Planctomycetia bacterium]|nr:hypothetical protein [Planctomycetia bacterium]
MPSIADHFVPAELVRILSQHRRRFLIPAAVIAGVATLYAAFRSSTWEASQALIVRNEAVARTVQERPGRFDRPEQMQTVQETILELARSRSVLAGALEAVGRPDGSHPANYPSQKDIERLGQSVKLVPPKGAEFGKTEIFYLRVQDSDRERAVRLATELSRQLQTQYQKLRDQRAQSMTLELAHTVSRAKGELANVTERLGKVESQVGADLSELRILEKSPSGNSDLRAQLITLENEMRDARTSLRTNQALRELLVASTHDAGHLLAAPNRLLESQPALKRLKEGLVDSQLRTSQLRGAMSDDHPRVLAALANEEEIRHNLTNELSLAISGIDVDLKLVSARIDTLSQQLAGVQTRLGTLANVRAEYSNLLDEIQHRQQNLQVAEENLADARAGRTAASSASLISQIDTPDTGSSPVGPGRTSIALGGILGGAIVGFGVVLLSVPPVPSPSNVETRVNGHAERAIANKPRRVAAPQVGGISIKDALARLAHRATSWN